MLHPLLELAQLGLQLAQLCFVFLPLHFLFHVVLLLKTRVIRSAVWTGIPPRRTMAGRMNALVKHVRHTPLLWLLAFVPVVFAAEILKPEGHTALFVLSVLAIVPLAALLSHATESVAAKTGDAVGGLLNATLGNLTELVIALTALRAGQYMLVKASMAGVIVTNTLFMLGGSFLLGGLKHHTQEFNRVGARVQAGLLFLATVALLIPSAVAEADSGAGSAITQKLSLGLAVLLIVAYGLGMLFSLKTHRELFASADHGEAGEAPWPIGLALATLAGVTVLVALVSEIFVESVQQAAETFGMTPAFVGFIVVALVGGAAEMAAAFSGARKNRLDLSVGIALGSASQIALFVAPVMVLLSYFIGPAPMDLQFWPGAVVMMLIAVLTASLVTNSGRSAWFVGVFVLMVYLIFAMTLYLLPPRVAVNVPPANPPARLQARARAGRAHRGSAVRPDHGAHLHRLAQCGGGRARRRARDAHRRPRVQHRVGHHRRHPVSHGLPGRAGTRHSRVAGGAQGRGPGGGAPPHCGGAAAAAWPTRSALPSTSPSVRSWCSRPSHRRAHGCQEPSGWVDSRSSSGCS